MSLHAITHEILSSVPGAWACCIMGTDGLPVEAVAADKAPENWLAWVTVVSAPLAALGRCAESGAPGGWEDAALGWPAWRLIVRALGAEHFVAVALGEEGFSGQAAYVLRQHAPTLMTVLFPAHAGRRQD